MVLAMVFDGKAENPVFRQARMTKRKVPATYEKNNGK